MEDVWITKVEIKNFQSHYNTVISFVKGTNALVGTSNSGKTSVIRAIRWCLLNTPNGTDFISVGENEAVVKVHLSNNKTIERRRARSKVNLYRLYENGELVEEYTGFGSKVPVDIQEAHGIYPIANDIYFQFADQLEAPFMLSLKPRQRADVLGNLEELMRIDKALNEINDDVRMHNKTKKQLEKEEKSLLLEREKVKAEVERLSSKIDLLKSLKKGIESKMTLKTYLTEQLSRLKEIQQHIISLNEIIRKATKITENWPEDIEDRIRYFKKLRMHIDRLKEIKQELESMQYMKEEKLKEIESLKDSIEEKISQYQSLNRSKSMLEANAKSLQEVENSFSERIANIQLDQLDLEVNKYKVLFTHLGELRRINQDIKNADLIIQETNVRINELLDEFAQALIEAEICPTCGRSTQDVHAHDLATII